MLGELFIKIIDRCIDILKRREEVNRSTFQDHVEPLFGQLQAVHQEYLDAFRRYRNRLLDPSVSFRDSEGLWDEICTDSLFSANARAKLIALVQMKAANNSLNDFTAAITNYIDCASDRTGSTLPPSQARKQRLPKLRPAKVSTRGRTTRGRVGTEHLTLSAIARFAQGTERFSRGSTFLQARNAYRPLLLAGFDHITAAKMSDQAARDAATQLVDQIVSNAQASYLHIVTEYAKLRRQLLKRI